MSKGLSWADVVHGGVLNVRATSFSCMTRYDKFVTRKWLAVSKPTQLETSATALPPFQPTPLYTHVADSCMLAGSPQS